MEFFESMDPLLRTFWYIALPTSLIFAVQTVLTFIGGDATDGLEADFDSDLDGGDSTFQLFSFRNLINFLLGFSWTGISFYDEIDSTPLLIGLSVLVGLVFLFLFFMIIRQLEKLAEDNSFKINECLNKTAEVYMQIPASKSGKGKVLISIKGSMRELDAITKSEESILSGTMVVVKEVLSENLLVVEII